MATRFVIKIQDAVIERREVKGRNGTFMSESQNAIADLPNGERRKVRVRVSRERGPYAPGSYTVGDESFSVGQYGDIEIGTLQLVPAQGAAAVPLAGASR